MERSTTCKTVSKKPRRRALEPTCPTRLHTTQAWFGKTIGQPLHFDHKLPLRGEEGILLTKESEHYIAPSKTLKPHERIEIYHQQYWWRLLKCLQENFPMVTRLFGYSEFNQRIGIPYLSHTPPQHWALCRLGESLPDWINNKYEAQDKDLILIAAQIDWAAQVAFWEKKYPPLKKIDPQKTNLTLQPYIQLFSLGANLLPFRDAFLQKEVSYWTQNPFPLLEYGAFYYVVFRSHKNQVMWNAISFSEYQVLNYLQQGLTIQGVCDRIEQGPYELVQVAQQELSLWFHRWTTLHWLIDLKHRR